MFCFFICHIFPLFAVLFVKNTEVPFSEECALYLSQGSVLFPCCLVLLAYIEGVGDKTKHITQQDSLLFGLEKTSKTTKSNPALPNPSRSHVPLVPHLLNASRDGNSATSLGSLFQCSIITYQGRNCSCCPI